MFASFLFLILGVLLGFVVLRATRSPLKLEEQIVWGIPIGTVLLAYWIFLLALALPNQDWALLAGVLSAGIWVLYYLNRDRHWQQIWHDLKQWRVELKRSDIIAWLIVLIPWLTYTIITVPFLLYFKDGDLIAGWINTWGDWAAHLRSSTFFAEQDKLSLEHPLFAHQAFHYPYISSYLASLLQRLGLSIDRSLAWPTLVLFGALPAVLYLFAKRLTNNRPASVIFSYLVPLAGGWGVWYLLQDIQAGKYFWEASAYSPLLYTDSRIDSLYSNQGIWFMNFIMSEFFPQRAFLAGIGVALYILLITWLGLTSKIDRKHLIFTGVLFGLLPLVHSHSFIAVGLTIPVLCIAYILGRFFQRESLDVRNLKLQTTLFLPLLWLLIPAAVVGIIITLFFVFDPTNTGSFMHPINWWVPNQDQPYNPLAYWLRNAGPLVVLGLVCFWALKSWRPFLFAGLALFILANSLSLQPWHYDNLKILTYWYLLWALPVAVLIVKLPELVKLQNKWVLLPIQLLLILLLTGAGAADAAMVTISTRTGLTLVGEDGVTFAKLVQQATSGDKQALFIAATNHDNPLSVVSGRRFYVGYEGWLWSYGIDGGKRLDEVQQMYAATPEGLQLLRDRNIGYIALGPQERERYKPNEAVLTTLFPTVVEYEQFRLLKVSP